ncbi:HAD hydrolase-like protein [Alphaproteobacteria bacterium]|nr:HAD hydrolase-like protein [Alphaproteobacteria bacterium]
MSIKDIKALTFDTGGTILDWHTGFKNAFEKAGEEHGIKKDWASITNELRRKSLKSVLNLGEHNKPEYNFDGGHRIALEEIVSEFNLSAFTEKNLYDIAYNAPHNFKVWDDFPEVLLKLKKKFLCVSFTLLSFKLIIDTARKNNLTWDAVFSCEGIGKYKILPEAYETAAKWLQLEPSECGMVACHNFDLDAAKKVGFKTIFVKRPLEWGEEGPPDPTANAHHDIIVDSFTELQEALGC